MSYNSDDDWGYDDGGEYDVGVITPYDGGDAIGSTLNDGSRIYPVNTNFEEDYYNDSSRDGANGGGFWDDLGSSLGNIFGNTVRDVATTGSQRISDDIYRRTNTPRPTATTARPANVSPAVMFAGFAALGLGLYFALRKS